MFSRGRFFQAVKVTRRRYLYVNISTASHLPHSFHVKPSRTTNKAEAQPYSIVSSSSRELLNSRLKAKEAQTLQTQRTGKMASYETVLKGKYPAKEHARKVVEYLRKKNPDVNGVLYLEGQKTKMIEDNDGEAPFRFATPSFQTRRSLTPSQTTPLLLLLDWLPPRRQLLHLRYSHRQINPLHSPNRRRVRNLVRTARL